MASVEDHADAQADQRQDQERHQGDGTLGAGAHNPSGGHPAHHGVRLFVGIGGPGGLSRVTALAMALRRIHGPHRCRAGGRSLRDRDGCGGVARSWPGDHSQQGQGNQERSHQHDGTDGLFPEHVAGVASPGGAAARSPTST